MLRFLGVRHLAVIDQLEVEFEPGLNILTGETGAGKSVLVEAIDLLRRRTRQRGPRAHRRRHGHRAGRLRTRRRPRSDRAPRDLVAGPKPRVHRRRARDGGGARDIGARPGRSPRSARASDAAGSGGASGPSRRVPGHRGDLVAGVAAAFEAWRAAHAALDRSRLDDREKRARIEMASFQLEEIDKVAPAAGEDDRLATERAVLANADRLSAVVDRGVTRRSTTVTIAALVRLAGRVEARRRTGGHRSALQSVPRRSRRDQVQPRRPRVSFCARTSRTSRRRPRRLQAVEDRLAALERLKRKYGPTLEDVLGRRDELRAELADLGASEERAAALDDRGAGDARRVPLAERPCCRPSDGARLRALARQLESALAELAMPSSRVLVRVESSDRPRPGPDVASTTAEFLLSPNPGEDPRPLARIASGGELSRVMLALRTLVDRDEGERTLVFDEVDAGIGGSAADAVGARLQALGSSASRCSASRIWRRSPRGRRRISTITKQVRAGRTHDSSHAARRRAAASRRLPA